DLAALNGVDPLTVGFNAASGNSHDDILEALKLALTAAGTTYSNLLSAAQGPTITPPAGLANALANNHQRFLTPPPTITSFSPASGAAGISVTITGTNFDPDPFHMLVTFADNVPATVTSATATQLVVTIPAGAATGTIKVTNGLTTREVTSSSIFAITTSGGSGGGTTTWTQRSSGTSYILNTVAFGNGVFVAGGNGNTITTSTDGITWTSRSSASSAMPDANYFAVNNIAWSNALNLFVAVGDRVGTSGATLLATSPDGVSWTRRDWTNTLSVANLWDIVADSTRVTVVGEKTILVSTDGSSWSSQTINNIGGMSLTGVASSGAIRVAVGTYNSSTGLMLVSTDGTTWASATTPVGFMPQDVTWNGSLFVAVGSSSPLQFGATPAVATSTDGLNWTLQTLPSSISSSAFVLNDITWDGTRLVAVGSPYALVNSRLFLTSSDGLTWTVDATINTGSGQKVPNGVTSNGTRTVSVGDTVFTRDF
ncbi:MAG: IPT/TIG domain-containing protein, partial [Sideroxydans sp.]|nr:IPT/TIG domain-containing protein [Sideroxydans sp.]